MPKLMEIPYLTLTLGQQGGIGLPPVIVKLDKWYAVSDSRDCHPPKEIESFLINQSRWNSPYNHTPTKYWHPQEWVYRKWHNHKTPRLTWADIKILLAQAGKN